MDLLLLVFEWNDVCCGEYVLVGVGSVFDFCIEWLLI